MFEPIGDIIQKKYSKKKEKNKNKKKSDRLNRITRDKPSSSPR
jgi:hypothetical protein